MVYTQYGQNSTSSKFAISTLASAVLTSTVVCQPGTFCCLLHIPYAILCDIRCLYPYEHVMESDIHYDSIRSLLMQCTTACDLSSTHAAGERRPGTVGQPLPGVSVKVAPLPADADEATDSDVVEGGSLSSRMSGSCTSYSLAGTVSTFLVEVSRCLQE